MGASHLPFLPFVAGQSTSRCGLHRRFSLPISMLSGGSSELPGSRSDAVDVTKGEGRCISHRAMPTICASGEPGGQLIASRSS
jgi:hypothetical protein